jgi:hypothetical protein
MVLFNVMMFYPLSTMVANVKNLFELFHPSSARGLKIAMPRLHRFAMLPAISKPFVVMMFTQFSSNTKCS